MLLPRSTFREQIADVALEPRTEFIECREADVLLADLHSIERGLGDPELLREAVLGHFSSQLAQFLRQSACQISHVWGT